MFLWIAFAFLTAAVLAAVLAPLARPRHDDETAGSAELGTQNVYRDQLHEIEADRARGVLSTEEAEAARLEVSRRLLASAGTEAPASPAPANSRHANIALVTSDTSAGH